MNPQQPQDQSVTPDVNPVSPPQNVYGPQSVVGQAVTQQPSDAQASVPNENSTKVAKKLRNTGSSVFALGIFLAIILPLAGLGANSSTISNKSFALGIYAAETVLAIGMVYLGHKLKKTTEIGQAKALLLPIILLPLAILILTVVGGFILKTGHLSLTGVLVLVLLIYVLVARAQINKLTR